MIVGNQRPFWCYAVVPNTISASDDGPLLSFGGGKLIWTDCLDGLVSKDSESWRRWRTSCCSLALNCESGYLPGSSASA